MKNMAQRLSMTILIGVFVVLGIGCGTTKTAAKKEAEPVAAAASQMEIYEVHHDRRIHVFYDRKLYHEFLELGETPFRLTRIGAGPNGETLVFGLTKDDKKNPEEVAAIKIYDKQMDAPAEVYGEMRRHGRIYVFDRFEDMQPVRQFGHPNFFYMEVGAGPKGETVVFVLNSENKKKRPDALIAKYKSINS
jgi:hypothetical protein